MSRSQNPASGKNGFEDLCQSFEEKVLIGLSVSLTEKSDKSLFLLALSGGADSTALTAAMASLRDKEKKLSFGLNALHVNHGIRPPENSAVDENAARELCSYLKIPFTVTAIPHGRIEQYAQNNGIGIEGAARHFRYKALGEEAQRLGAAAIITGHTRDDRLETILMAFLRGSGPAGLGALSGNTAMPGFSVIVLRPLLSLYRTDVLAYLKERNLDYCNDETNADEHFFRNRIRRVLIPLLDRQFPHWREPVLRLGDTQAITASFLAEEAEKRLPWDNFSLSTEQFFSEPEILREEALFLVLDRIVHEGKRPRRDPLRSFVRERDSVIDLGFALLENKNGRISVKKTERSPAITGFSVLIKRAGIYKLNGITVFAGTQYIDTGGAVVYAVLPLVLRSAGKGKILAEDRKGRAALFRFGSLVWKRESSPVNGGMSFTILFNGGSYKDGSG